MPDVIWPAIMPGRYTIPEADIALILGMSALVIAARKIGRIASHLLAPSAKREARLYAASVLPGACRQAV